MKSLAFMFLLILGATKLWGLGSHGHCREEQPLNRPENHTVRQVALVSAADDVDFKARVDREPAEGLPVPIYPGTRVTQAELEPPRLRTESLELDIKEPVERLVSSREKTPHPSPSGSVSWIESKTVTGQISATEDRARQDARRQLQHRVTDWLVPDVPTSWKAPAPLIDHLIVKTEIVPIVKEYGTLYKATLFVDSAPVRRAEIVAAYHHDLVERRITIMGGGLAAILACLAAVAGYIRADEATRGYYTNWLRAAAAAGVGASSVMIYRLLA